MQRESIGPISCPVVLFELVSANSLTLLAHPSTDIVGVKES